MWGKNLEGQGNSWCKGPGVEMCLVFLRNSKEARVAGAVRRLVTGSS